jgi:hypothetical protein
MLITERVCLVQRVFYEVGPSERLRHLDEQPVIAGRDDDVAIRGRERLERGDGRMTRAHRPRHLAGRRVAHHGVFEEGQLAVEQRDIYLGGLTGALAVQQRRVKRDGGVEAAGQVAD